MTDFTLNKIVHEQSRLKILALLASGTATSLTFTHIKTQLSFTAGNLSIQLKTLEEAGYITLNKYIDGKKPRTDVCIKKEGKLALSEYMSQLEKFLASLSGNLT